MGNPSFVLLINNFITLVSEQSRLFPTLNFEVNESLLQSVWNGQEHAEFCCY